MPSTAAIRAPPLPRTQGVSDGAGRLRTFLVTPTGSEPLRFSQEKRKVSKQAKHNPKQICQIPPPLPPELTAWHSLPPAIRAGILAMVKAAGA